MAATNPGVAEALAPEELGQGPTAPLVTDPAEPPLDSGHPIQVSENLWLRVDGTKETHSGFGPVVVPPPANDIERFLLIRAYHLAKLDKAQDLLRSLLAMRYHITELHWDAKLWGPLPRKQGRFGREHDIPAATDRIERTVKFHGMLFRMFDRVLRGRGVNPDGLPRV
jgi:hypothetical protein